jgi:hypothetical protein
MTYAAACNNENGFLGIKPWYAGLCKNGTNDVEIKQLPQDIIVTVLNVFSIFIVVISYAAVAMVIYGGIKYLISVGDPAKTSAARHTIQNALIGLLLALMSLAIVNYVTEELMKK